ncbi:MAG: hypothetical protein ACRERC_08250 [Candidatus Binatia bacterium]
MARPAGRTTVPCAPVRRPAPAELASAVCVNKGITRDAFDGGSAGSCFAVSAL